MVRGIKVAPTSRKALRAQAEDMRTQLGITNPYFPILELVDLGLGQLFPQYIVDVVPDGELGNDHALTIPDERVIMIREDVYVGAFQGRGRDRFTLAHEVGHLLLHGGIRLARTSGRSQTLHKPYEDSEWQADVFAAELLMPVESAQACYPSVGCLAETCGVSEAAAKVRFSVLRKEGLV